MSARAVLNFFKHYNHNIWKIHAFQESKFLAIEIRNTETQEASFDILDLYSNQIVSHIVTQEDWWINIAHIIDEEVIFYTFEADNNPEPKEYMAYNAVSGNKLWNKQEFNLSNFSQTKGETKNIEIISPFQYPGNSEYFNTVKEFLKSQVEVNPVRDINYYENEQFIFISYYEETNKLANYLLVLTLNGEVIFKENLGDFQKGITDQSFFLIDNKLIFVKDVNDFFIYELITDSTE